MIGGTKVALEPFGLKLRDLTDRGLSVWLWDRSGTRGEKLPMEPGQRRHGKEAAAVFQLAKHECADVGWLTFSGGSIAPLMSLQSTGSLQPRFLIDVEGPSDRLSIRRPVPDNLIGTLKAEREYGDPPPHEHIWEPYRLLASFRGAYYRFQGTFDHMHKHCLLHSEVMIQAAGSGSHLNNRVKNEPRRDLQGQIRDHGGDILTAIDSGFAD